MKSILMRRLAVVGVVSAGALAAAGPATAAASPFGCTASVARATMTGPLAGTQHFVQANSAVNPCASQDRTIPAGSQQLPGLTVSWQRAGAFTGSSNVGDATAAISPSAGATAATVGITLAYTGDDGARHIVQISQASATAADTCAAGAAVPTGNSTIGDIHVDGQPVVTPDDPSIPAQINLPDSNGSYLAINRQSVSGGALTQDAALLHISGAGDLAVDEAQVNGGSCSQAVSVPGAPSVTLCPNGSSFQAAQLSCELLAGASKIRVGLPYQGATGGLVMPLAVARRLYPGNPCVKGAGPAYVIVATSRSHVINGTHGADRILGLSYNDRLAGLAGNDCLSAGNGRDLLYDSNGNDRVFAGNGRVRVGLGNGKNLVRVGNGSDWVSAGRGANTVYVGRGGDRIDLGRGRNHVHTGHGRDRVYSPGRHAQVACVNRRDVVFLARGAARYARAHGCTRIRVVR